jgi:biotin operon repressor
MYSPTVRVLTVLELLQSRERVTGAEIAERLEVHIRTVRRTIAMLEAWGIPVEAERGRYGAYRLLPGYKLPPLMLTQEEAIATTLGLLAARKLGLTATSDCSGWIASNRWRRARSSLSARRDLTCWSICCALWEACPGAGPWKCCCRRRWRKRAGGSRRRSPCWKQRTTASCCAAAQTTCPGWRAFWQA